MGAQHENGALWLTVFIEAFMIIAVGLYNMYEVRKVSDKVQGEIAELSAYSAVQGQKIDRILTALEAKYGSDFEPAGNGLSEETLGDPRTHKALDFINRYVNEPSKAEPAESSEPVTTDSDLAPTK